VDLVAATEAGIPVTNTFFCQQEVANHTFALLLAATRKLIPMHNQLAQGVWAPELQPPVPPLNEQTLGLIGLGHIGREVAKRARAFDLAIIAYDPHVDARTAVKHGVELVGLDEVFERADFVSAHAPLNDSTFHIVNARTLALMKPTAYFFNTARGPLVDEPALSDALKSGRIAGAGLDVFEQEPTAPDNPLYGLPNVVLTPHAAGYSDHSITRGRQMAATEMARMLNGSYPTNLLNPEVKGATRAPYA
jgi:D-3-phosphoglycerate dehydrogenase